MKRQALTLAATAALGFGTLLIGQAQADDNSNAGQSAINNATGAQNGAAGTQAGAAAGQTDANAQGAAQGAAQSAAEQQGQTADASGGKGDLRQALQAATDPDKLYVVMSAIDNQCEIQLGQLALKNSQDDQVKQIAQKMIDDHTKAQQQLQQVAQQIGVQLPQIAPMTGQAVMKVFESLNGKPFDQMYVSHLRAAHAKCVSETTDVAQLAKNDQVKQYAQQQLPILQEHYQHLQQAAVALGLPSSTEAQTAGARIGGSPSDQNANGASGSNTQGQTGGANSTGKAAPSGNTPAGGTTGQQ
jgi:putative membrane protein